MTLPPPWAQDPNCPAVDRFLLGPELGRGGMGRVHEAWDPLLRRRLALKLLLGRDAELCIRFLREAQCQAKVKHPHVCQVLEVGQDLAQPYIAMELVEGRHLGELRGELGPRELAELMVQVAEGVGAAHKAGLIHRDLKPTNILVEGSRAVVVDFGLAQDFRALDLTLSWSILGTPAFMSPEQARGEALGPATDLYSLGATLYAVLSGQPPYEGTSLAGLLTQQGERGVPPLRRRMPDLPRDLETIVLTCLETEPARRYGSAQALAEDLRRFLRGEPIQARPVGPLGRLWRWARRKPALAASLAVGLLVAAALGAWNLRTQRQAAQRERAAQRFGMEIRDAEHLLRIERMMPLHDIRPAEARVRARMAEIRQEMTQLGGVAQGPGWYALGRGHLALREHAEAVKVFQAAWDSGFRAPELAHSMALAMLHQVHDDRCDVAPSPGMHHEIITRRLAPVRPWLERARGARVENPDFVAALVAYWENRLDECQVLLDRSLEKTPWLFEAWSWKGRLQHRKFGGTIGTESALEAARKHLLQAVTLAPSDTEARVLLVEHWLSLFLKQSQEGNAPVQPRAEADALLAESLRVSPEDAGLWITRLHLVYQRAWAALHHGVDPAPELKRALGELGPDRLARMGGSKASTTQLRLMTHNAWWGVAELDYRYGRDPWPALRQAEGFYPWKTGWDPQRMASVLLAWRAGGPLQELEVAIEATRREPGDTWGPAMAAEALLERGDLRGAAELLEGTVRRHPQAVFAWALLPLTRARLAESGQADFKPALEAAALAEARFPRHYRAQLGVAEVHLAHARHRMRQGLDPAPALARARRALAASERANPRYFDSCRVRAELEDFAGNRAAARQACLRGLALKGDARPLRVLLESLGQPAEGPGPLSL